MKLDEVDIVTRNTLATQYRQDGMAVLSDIDLPNVFAPASTSFVFLKVGDRCEVYCGGDVAYQGASDTWRQIARRRPSPGNTRKLLETRGDLFTGVGKLRALLQEAGGVYSPLPAAQGDRQPTGGPAQPTAQPVAQAAPAEAAPLRPEEMDAPLPEPAGQPSRDGRMPAPRQNGPAPALRNLVEDCRRTPRQFAGREDMLRALKTNLIRESKPGIVLIGKEGVGKTAIVEMLAMDIAFNRDIPATLTNTPIYDLPLGSLVENGRYIGDIERQARRYLDVHGRPIFFADEIHQLARQELRPLADILKPALAAGRIRLVGATTPAEWRKVEDNAFKRRFMDLTVEEPSPWDTFQMLTQRVKALASHHQIAIDEALVREAIMLCSRYVPMRQFPDKAIDILDLAAALQTTHPVAPPDAGKNTAPASPAVAGGTAA